MSKVTGPDHGAQPVGGAQLGTEVLEVLADGRRTGGEPVCDGRRGQSIGQEFQDRLLAPGEPHRGLFRTPDCPCRSRSDRSFTQLDAVATVGLVAAPAAVLAATVGAPASALATTAIRSVSNPAYAAASSVAFATTNSLGMTANLQNIETTQVLETEGAELERMVGFTVIRQPGAVVTGAGTRCPDLATYYRDVLVEYVEAKGSPTAACRIQQQLADIWIQRVLGITTSVVRRSSSGGIY